MISNIYQESFKNNKSEEKKIIVNAEHSILRSLISDHPFV